MSAAATESPLDSKVTSDTLEHDNSPLRDISPASSPSLRQERLSVASISNLINHDSNPQSSSETGNIDKDSSKDHRKRKQLDSKRNDPLNIQSSNESPSTLSTTTTSSTKNTTNVSSHKRRRVSPSLGSMDETDIDDGGSINYNNNNNVEEDDNVEEEDEIEFDELAHSHPSSPTTPGNSDLVEEEFSPKKITACMSSTSHHPTVGGIILPPSTFNGKQTRKKPYIPRPPNSFILYRQHHHPLILNQHPGINNSEISRIIADHWRNLGDHEKQEWRRKADEAKQDHQKAYPDYKYQPRRRVNVGSTFRKANIPNSSSDGSQDNFVIESRQPPLQRGDDNHKLSMIMRDGDAKNVSSQGFTRGNNFIIERGSKELSKTARSVDALKAKLQFQTRPYKVPNPVSLANNLFMHQSPKTPTHLSPPHVLISPQSQPVTSPTSSSMSPVNGPLTPRGAMIVLEGCEEESISLQANKLCDFLKNEGIKAELWRFSDRETPVGAIFSGYLEANRQQNPKARHLIISAHWWELYQTMQEKLLNGTTLIFDRYIYTAIAESAAAGLDIVWCKAAYVHILRPDLIFFLDGAGSDMERQRNGPDEGVRQCRMRGAFKKLLDKHWKILDACKSSVLIHTQILESSMEVIERCRKGYSTYNNNNVPPMNIPDQRQKMQPPPLGRHEEFLQPYQVQL